MSELDAMEAHFLRAIEGYGEVPRADDLANDLVAIALSYLPRLDTANARVARLTEALRGLLRPVAVQYGESDGWRPLIDAALAALGEEAGRE